MPTAKSPSRRFTRRTTITVALLVLVVASLAWDGSPLGSVLMRQAVHLKFRDVRRVTPAELVRWTQDPNRPPPLLVDARPADQFAMSHIQGAVNIDATAPNLTPLEHVPRDQPVVVYDGPGVIGAAMVVGLAEAGFSRLSNLDGGLFRWANEGHPIVSDSGPATSVHPVSWGWGRLLKSRFHP